MNDVDIRTWKFKHLIVNPRDEEIRALAKPDETTTEFGSASYLSKIRSRSAAFTRSDVDGEILSEDYLYLEKLNKGCGEYELLRLDRQLGQGEFTFHCRLYVSSQFARLALEFVRSLEPYPNPDHKPDFCTLDLPEWSEGQRRILVFAGVGVTFVLGSDYYGEIKKSFLRQAMYRMKQKEGLGLHAGSKEVTFIKDNKRETQCLLLFGLSGTGKTSLTCHDFGFNKGQENTTIKQDDVVLIDENSRCFGTEAKGFYIKTEGLTVEEQPLLYKAAIHPDTVFENVYVDKKTGKVDFFNSEFSSNARAIVPVKEIEHTSKNINSEKVHKLFFITRNPLMPPIAKLNPEQSAASFMLGESIKTSAADPNAKGEPVREVGTNPFIMGSKGEEGNRIYAIIKKNHLESYLLNTGFLGANKNKKVKLDDTVFFIRNSLLGNVQWVKDAQFGFEIPAKVLGQDVSEWQVKKYYGEKEYNDAAQALKKSRREWLDQFPDLDPIIKRVVI